MKFVIFGLLLLVSLNVFAGSVTVDSKSKWKYFELHGCTSLNVLTQEMGYVVTPSLNAKTDVVICDDHIYTAPSMIMILQSLAKRAAAKNCFQIQVNKTDRTAKINFLPGIKRIVKQSETDDTYFINGRPPFLQAGIISESSVNLCVFQKESAESPYSDLLGY